MPRTTLHTCPLPISRHVPKLSPQTVSVSDSDILCLVSASPIPNNNKRTKNNTPQPDSRFLTPKQHPDKSPLPLVLPSPYPSPYTPRVTRHNPPPLHEPKSSLCLFRSRSRKRREDRAHLYVPSGLASGSLPRRKDKHHRCSLDVL